MKQETLEEVKQTAVEFLYQELDNILELYPSEWDKIDKVYEQAKEMEKQQQGYNEEEVENILIEYVKTNPTKPYRVVSWFQQFKNQLQG